MQSGRKAIAMKLSNSEIAEILTRVKDPEIPSLDIVEMGIFRDSEFQEEKLIVHITPTYSGCPAMDVITADILAVLSEAGFEKVEINTILSPAWTTDWLTEEAKQKLKEAGIAPPGERSSDIVPFPKKKAPVPCPFCESVDTELRSEFASTPCKSLYYCKACNQPFNQFKPH